MSLNFYSAPRRVRGHQSTVYIFCKHCQAQQPRGRKYCSECGKKLKPYKKTVVVAKCSRCGHEEDSRSYINKYHGRCGGKFKRAEVKREVVTGIEGSTVDHPFQVR